MIISNADNDSEPLVMITNKALENEENSIIFKASVLRPPVKITQSKILVHSQNFKFFPKATLTFTGTLRSI